MKIGQLFKIFKMPALGSASAVDAQLAAPIQGASVVRRAHVLRGSALASFRLDATANKRQRRLRVAIDLAPLGHLLDRLGVLPHFEAVLVHLAAQCRTRGCGF